MTVESNQNGAEPDWITRWFRRPNLGNSTSPVEPGTFEIGLVLGGTVAAGAYTAGVLDFLIEALDAWEALRKTEPAQAPKHKVLIKIITGTSGGGVNAAIAARALAYKFPHVSNGTAKPSMLNPNTGWATGKPVL